jgi:hypothetical protein
MITVVNHVVLARLHALRPWRQHEVFRLHLNACLQLEMKLAVAALLGQMRITLDPAKMSAKTPEDLMANVLGYVTLVHKGGVHLLMTPRAACATAGSC